MLKRFSIVLLLIVALSLVFVGSAYANFGPHGGYANDTDACAGCHRAHTSFSTVGWKDNGGNTHASALLVGNAQSMTEFCYACHGDYAPGASTNVASGIFDAGPSADVSTSVPATSNTGAAFDRPGPGVVTAYQTSSHFNAPLNGGGFNRMPNPYTWQTSATVAYTSVSSAHRMDYSGPLWGAGSAVDMNYGGSVGLTCTDCHDPHGSSNYRLLKDSVNGHSVGGYNSSDIPTPFVVSGESGYPVPNTAGTVWQGGVQSGSWPNGGWLKHEDGAAQMANYRPNYTDTTGTPIVHTEGGPSSGTSGYRSISAWCSACHENYNQASAGSAVSYNYNPNIPAQGSFAGAAASQVGTQNFHRHPIDQTLANGNLSANVLTAQVVSDNAWVPLEWSNIGDGGVSDFTDNYIGCLTCHRAHGSDVAMTGFAASHLETTSVTTTSTPHTIYIPVKDSVAGVDPDKGVYNGQNMQGSSALLRADNRGVCERCHNK